MKPMQNRLKIWLLWVAMLPAAAQVYLISLLPVVAHAQAPKQQFLQGHVPQAVHSLPSLGNLPGTNFLNLAIGLPLRNQATLNDLLKQIYDPSSPNYHHYLTPEEFTEQFGPTENDYRKLITF